jgi:integral membrane protein
MEPLAATALKRYRVMAFVVGAALVILTALIAIFGMGTTAPRMFSPLHGVLYIVYLATLPGLLKYFQISKGKLFLLIASGIIPILAFIVEAVTMKNPVLKPTAPTEQG